MLLILICMVLLAPKGIDVVKKAVGKNKKTIVIDAGHGGFDPGKIGVNKALEKDINLSIALKLEKLLKKDYKVVMTRTTDVGLYQQTDRNKKSADLRKRVEIINESNAELTISIHQNSFGQESSKGAQVFYHASSTEGKILADTMQEQIKETIADGNHRVAKENNSYYLLKKTEKPIIIIECGFLSNAAEAELLLQEDYQDKMAKAIKQGVKKYLEQQ